MCPASGTYRPRRVQGDKELTCKWQAAQKVQNTTWPTHSFHRYYAIALQHHGTSYASGCFNCHATVSNHHSMHGAEQPTILRTRHGLPPCAGRATPPLPHVSPLQNLMTRLLKACRTCVHPYPPPGVCAPPALHALTSHAPPPSPAIHPPTRLVRVHHGVAPRVVQQAVPVHVAQVARPGV